MTQQRKRQPSRRQAMVAGDDAGENEIPQCALVRVSQSNGICSAVFIGGAWALGAFHSYQTSKTGQIFLPIARMPDQGPPPGRTFEIIDAAEVSASGLALLKLKEGPPGVGLPRMLGISVATEAEFRNSSGAFFCGFGSNQCDSQNPGGIPGTLGQKRLTSQPHAIIRTNPPPGLMPSEFAVRNTGPTPLVCPADSGGAALIRVGNIMKLAGIIQGSLLGAAVRSTKITPFLDELRKKTGLPLNS
jgi:hypothetical protein